jgi:Flp pilus assembly protein TadD
MLLARLQAFTRAPQSHESAAGASRHDEEDRVPTRNRRGERAALGLRPICTLLLAAFLGAGCGGPPRPLQPRTYDLDELQRAAAAAPAATEPLVQLALLHRARGEPDLALQALGTALRRSRDDAPALTLLAKMFYECGRSADALRYFASRPLGGWPEPVRLDVALLLADVGERDAARGVLDGLRAGPYGGAAEANLAWLDLLDGDVAGASARLQQLSNAEPEVRNNKAVAMLQAGDVETSEALLRALVAEDERFTAARTNLALLRRHWRLDDGAAAEAEPATAAASRLSDQAVRAFLAGDIEDAAPPAPAEGSADAPQ